MHDYVRCQRRFGTGPDGRYANSPLEQWFDQLASGKGMCCSFADGFRVHDVDWDTQDGRYRVRLEGEWVVVPDEALVSEPNHGDGVGVHTPLESWSMGKSITATLFGILLRKGVYAGDA